MLVQFAINVLAVVTGPIAKVNLFSRRFYHQRQWLVVTNQALADGIEMGQINGFTPDRTYRFLYGNSVFHVFPLKKFPLVCEHRIARLRARERNTKGALLMPQNFAS